MKKKKTAEISINTDWCKGCGICVAFCPNQVLEMNRKDKSEATRLDDCIACMQCELHCPDLAIEVITA
jgi:2-oxoglutarate ferredoxin oxidoreductase subunit delta